MISGNFFQVQKPNCFVLEGKIDKDKRQLFILNCMNLF